MIKATIVVLVGLSAAALLRQRSAALRHWVLACAMACAAFLPVVELVVPSWTFQAMAPFSVAHSETGQEQSGGHREPLSTEAATPYSFTLARAIDAVWHVGMWFSILALCAGLVRVRWLASRAIPVQNGRWAAFASEISREQGIRRTIRILQSEHPHLLVTWGFLEPRVMLPRDAAQWPDNRVRVVLRHELAHIRRGDWITQLAAELLRAMYWFNPVFWAACSRLRYESERACDDAVLRQGVGGREYASHLLALARGVRENRGFFPESPAPAMIRPSSLERRVAAMLNEDVNRTPVTFRSRIGIIGASAAVTVLIAGLGATAQTLATLSGSILDPMNLGVPRATVVLTNTATQAKHEVRTDERGSFEFGGLAPGDYKLEAKFPGFMELTGQVSLSGLDVQRTLKLELGRVQETVSVRSNAHQTTGPPPRPPVRLDRSLENCTPSSTGGNIRPPKKLRDHRPVYPADLAARAIGGTVVLQGRIGVDGFIRALELLEATHPDFAAAATEAVRQWQFDATLLNCVPTEVVIGVTVRFDVEQ